MSNPSQINNLSILTGAGFTRNFDGFLAQEMWSKIFNSPLIQRNQKLRGLLQVDPDYESVYSKVLEKDRYSNEEKEIIKKVYEDTYRKLDDVTMSWQFNERNPTSFNTYGLNALLKIFDGSPNKTSFFFTLNQDLVMERRNGYKSTGTPNFPINLYNSRKNLESNDFIILPSRGVEEKVEESIKNHDGIHYIKLHGSYGWRSSSGSNQMVIGKNKEDMIIEEPLLYHYWILFKKAINQKNAKLLIIGYGFRDIHVNKMILDAIQMNGLKLYIITTIPTLPELENQMRMGHFYALDMLNGVSGYFPYTFSEIFPRNQVTTMHFREIQSALLEES